MKKFLLFIVAAVSLALPLWAQAAAGDLDPSFGSGGRVLTDFGSSHDLVSSVAIEPGGKIVAAGDREAGGNEDFALARYNSDGSLDPSFGSGGKVLTDFGSRSDLAHAVAIEPDGKIAAAGHSDAGASEDFALARYNSDGSLDASFGSGGKLLTDFGRNDFALAVAIEPNGKIVAAGQSIDGSRDFALARYNSDGSLDASFGSGGKVLTHLGSFDLARAVAVEPNRKIVAFGSSVADAGFDFALVRYNSDGSLDPSFGSGGKVLTDFGSSSFDEGTAVAIEPDGKIVAAGDSEGGVGSLDVALARYNSDGSLDPSFGSGGKVLTDFGSLSDDEVSAVALEPDGKIVAAGQSDAGGFQRDFALARYNSDGSLDASFGSGGKVLTDFGDFEFARSVATEPNGKIVAAGVSSVGVSDDFALARYLAR